jgi:ubiquinone/menaquinone biosynthesis C-methylase UbiE
MSNQSGETWNNVQRAYWDSIANKYDVLYSNYWSRSEDAQTAQLLSQVITVNCKVLDLACGTGKGNELCRSLVGDCQYIGIDISPDMIVQCKKKHPRLIVEIGEMSNLSRFEAETFDAVISLYTSFSFTNKPQETIAEVYRVLKPGGRTFVSALNCWSLRRLVRAKIGQYEEYRTRNSETAQASVPAWTYSRHYLKTVFLEAGFSDVLIWGQSCLGGVVESRALWKLNVLISKLMPGLCHILNVVATKSVSVTETPEPELRPFCWWSYL